MTGDKTDTAPCFRFGLLNNLRDELLPNLPANYSIRVFIREDQGKNSVTLNMTRTRITSLIWNSRVADLATRTTAR